MEALGLRLTSRGVLSLKGCVFYWQLKREDLRLIRSLPTSGGIWQPPLNTRNLFIGVRCRIWNTQVSS